MITLITSNRHKFEEIREMFLEAGLDLEWKQMKYEEIQADSTEEVSRDSCVKLSGMMKGDFFIEDTGLFIDVLGGFPGVYSSYVQKTIGNTGIIRLMNGKSSSARFKTVVSACIDGSIHQYTGLSEGRISLVEAGEKGFGYDPIFVPEGESRTLAEMSVNEKNSVSHRSRAVAQLIKALS